MLQQQFRTNWVWLLFLESSHRLALFAFVQFHVVLQVWLESERFVTFTAVVFTSACHPRSQGWLWSINFWAAFSIPTPATTPRALTLNCSEYSPFACFLALCSSRLVWSENFFLQYKQCLSCKQRWIFLWSLSSHDFEKVLLQISHKKHPSSDIIGSYNLAVTWAGTRISDFFSSILKWKLSEKSKKD